MTDAVRAVHRFPLFAALDPGWVAGWAADAPVRTVPAGTTLARENGRGDHLFLIEAGKVRVQRRTPGGRDRTMGDAGPGELLGDYALLPPGTFPATVRVTGAARVRWLPLDPLRAAVAHTPGVARNLRAWLRLHYSIRYQTGEVFLGFMSAPSFLYLFDEADPMKVPAGWKLPADRWFWVRSGHVAIRARGAAPVTVTAGGWFGLHTLLGQQPTAEAVAATEVEGLSLTREAFLGRRAATWHVAAVAWSHAGPTGSMW